MTYSILHTRRKSFIGAVCAVGIAAVVAACSSSTGAATPTDQSVQESGTADTGSTGETHIKMIAWPGPEGDALAQVVDTYNAGQGKDDGVSVEMVLLSRQDTAAKEIALMKSHDSENDLYWTASHNLSQYIPYLDPIDNFDLDTTDYFPSAIDGLTFDGQLYGLPLDLSNHFLYYRTDLIDDLLNDPDATAKYRSVSNDILGEATDPKSPADGWSIDDFRVMSAYFTQGVNPDSPTQYGTILQLKNLRFNVMIWNDFLWGYGGNWEDDGTANLNTDAALKAVELYAEFYKNGWTSPDSAQAEFPETQAALQSGSVAFAVQWSAGFAGLNDPEQSPDIAGKVGIAPVPGGNSHVHALSISLNKYGKNRDAAQKWMQYLTQPEVMAEYARAGGVPSMPEVLNQEQDTNPVFSHVAASISTDGFSEPVFAKSSEAFDVLADDLSAAWTGQEDPQAATQTANADLQGLLDAGN